VDTVYALACSTPIVFPLLVDDNKLLMALFFASRLVYTLPCFGFYSFAGAARLLAKLLRPGGSEVTFTDFESSCHLF